MPSVYEFEWIVEQNPNIDWMELCKSLINDNDYYASDAFLQQLCLRMQQSKNYKMCSWANKMLAWRWESEVFWVGRRNYKDDPLMDFSNKQKLRTLMTFITQHLLENNKEKLDG